MKTEVYKGRKRYTRLTNIILSWCTFLGMSFLLSCSKNGVTPTALEVSPSGELSRYEVMSSDYDVMPAASFVASYNNSGVITNLFQTVGQTLSSFSLSYSGGMLTGATANDLATQTLSYGTGGKPVRVNYTTLTDTGKLVFTYNASGKLISVLDSVKRPLQLPLRYQYLYTYDAGGNNVVQITKNRLDISGRPTLIQYSFYTFDTHPNPFVVFPYLQGCANLPGGFPALVNKNNIISTQLVGTILKTSSGSTVPVLDTITNYRSSRIYDYTAQGFPSKATEKFNDIQFNYSGNRTFTYEY